MKLLDHVRDVLQEQGELGTVEALLFQLLARGTGATRQRTAYANVASFCDVIADAVHVTGLPASQPQNFTQPSLLTAERLAGERTEGLAAESTEPVTTEPVTH
jgi:carboxylate-amine ligase